MGTGKSILWQQGQNSSAHDPLPSSCVCRKLGGGRGAARTRARLSGMRCEYPKQQFDALHHRAHPLPQGSPQTAPSHPVVTGLAAWSITNLQGAPEPECPLGVGPTFATQVTWLAGAVQSGPGPLGPAETLWAGSTFQGLGAVPGSDFLGVK